MFAPSGRQLAFRVDAPTVRTPQDVRTAPPGDERALVFVVAAVDGDTLRLRGGETVRLIGVDTPETKHPRKPVQRCGAEASAFAHAAVDKRWVALEPDRGGSSTARDKYGRWLAYAHRDPDGFFLNAELVRQGAGRAYTRFPFRLREWFVELESQARAERLGVWAEESAGLCDLPAGVLARAEQQPPRREANPPAPVEARQPEEAPEPAPRAPEPEAPPAVREPAQAPNVPPAVRQATPRPAPSATGPAPAARQAGCDIKGNVARDGERIYHVPGGQSYSRTQINTAHGERWFCSEEEARAAGWRRAAR